MLAVRTPHYRTNPQGLPRCVRYSKRSVVRHRDRAGRRVTARHRDVGPVNTAESNSRSPAEHRTSGASIPVLAQVPWLAADPAEVPPVAEEIALDNAYFEPHCVVAAPFLATATWDAGPTQLRIDPPQPLATVSDDLAATPSNNTATHQATPPPPPAAIPAKNETTAAATCADDAFAIRPARMPSHRPRCSDFGPWPAGCGLAPVGSGHRQRDSPVSQDNRSRRTADSGRVDDAGAGEPAPDQRAGTRSAHSGRGRPLVRRRVAAPCRGSRRTCPRIDCGNGPGAGTSGRRVSSNRHGCHRRDHTARTDRLWTTVAGRRLPARG